MLVFFNSPFFKKLQDIESASYVYELYKQAKKLQ